MRIVGSESAEIAGFADKQNRAKDRTDIDTSQNSHTSQGVFANLDSGNE